MTKRMEIVEEARTWIGTPYHHAGRVKKVGVDCIGTIVAPAIAAGIAIEDVLTYTRQPNPANALRLLAERMDQIAVADARIGDVLFIWLTHDSEPHHFAMLTPKGILHMRSDVVRGARIRGGNVCETGLPVKWAEQIHSAWRFRGLED